MLSDKETWYGRILNVQGTWPVFSKRAYGGGAEGDRVEGLTDDETPNIMTDFDKKSNSSWFSQNADHLKIKAEGRFSFGPAKDDSVPPLFWFPFHARCMKGVPTWPLRHLPL